MASAMSNLFESAQASGVMSKPPSWAFSMGSSLGQGAVGKTMAMVEMATNAFSAWRAGSSATAIVGSVASAMSKRQMDSSPGYGSVGSAALAPVNAPVPPPAVPAAPVPAAAVASPHVVHHRPKPSFGNPQGVSLFSSSSARVYVPPHIAPVHVVPLAAVPVPGGWNILDLPDEMIDYMFSFLGVRERVRCASVCRVFKRVSLDEHHWGQRAVSFGLAPFDVYADPHYVSVTGEPMPRVRALELCRRVSRSLCMGCGRHLGVALRTFRSQRKDVRLPVCDFCAVNPESAFYVRARACARLRRHAFAD